MSVITSHILRCDGIQKMLLDAGIVAPGTLYSRRRKQNVFFDSLFDIEKCDAVIAQDTWNRNKEQGWERLRDDLTWEHFEYTEAELKELQKMPVYLTENEMRWCLNYGQDDTPMMAFASRFPSVTFEYANVTEGHVDFEEIWQGKRKLSTEEIRRSYKNHRKYI